MPPSLKHRPSLSSTLLQCIALYQQNSGSVEVNWHRCCTKESIFLHQSPWANPGDEGDVLGALKDAERFDYQPLLRQRSTLESMMKIIKGIHIWILKKSSLVLESNFLTYSYRRGKSIPILCRISICSSSPLIICPQMCKISTPLESPPNKFNAEECVAQCMEWTGGNCPKEGVNCEL